MKKEDAPQDLPLITKEADWPNLNASSRTYLSLPSECIRASVKQTVRWISHGKHRLVVLVVVCCFLTEGKI